MENKDSNINDIKQAWHRTFMGTCGRCGRNFSFWQGYESYLGFGALAYRCKECLDNELWLLERKNKKK